MKKFVCSVCGYVWEVLIFLVKEGTFRNRGFLYGPWLPVYGIGAVLFSVVLSPRELLPDSSGKYKKNHPVTVFFLSTLLGSGLELVIGWFLDFFWNLRYWDYSGYFLNFRGYICLASAFGFGVGGVLAHVNEVVAAVGIVEPKPHVERTAGCHGVLLQSVAALGLEEKFLIAGHGCGGSQHRQKLCVGLV